MLKKILIFTFLAFPAQAQILANKDLNILFIGNSYTAANNMPKMLEKIAASDTRGNYREVPIGNYWLYGLGKDSKIELYSGDGSHPSVVGSYFTALIFYRYFTARPLDDVDYFPSEIKADDIKMIKLLAAAKL